MLPRHACSPCRKVVVVCNLKPAKMRDVMSYGMVRRMCSWGWMGEGGCCQGLLVQGIPLNTQREWVLNSNQGCVPVTRARAQFNWLPPFIEGVHGSAFSDCTKGVVSMWIHIHGTRNN